MQNPSSERSNKGQKDHSSYLYDKSSSSGGKNSNGRGKSNKGDPNNNTSWKSTAGTAKSNTNKQPVTGMDKEKSAAKNKDCNVLSPKNTRQEKAKEDEEEDLFEYPCSMVFLNPITVNIPNLEEITKCSLFHADASVTTYNGDVIQMFCHIYGINKVQCAIRQVKAAGTAMCLIFRQSELPYVTTHTTPSKGSFVYKGTYGAGRG